MVDVTSEDREAAIQAMNAIERQRSFGGNGTALRQVAEAFARHRLAARPAPDGEPIPMNAIVLQIEAASDRDKMWGRRWQALRALNYHNTHFADSDGRWTLADFISYAGEVCGWQEPVAHPPSNEPVDTSGNDALSQDVVTLVIAAREAWEANGSSGDDLDRALEAFGERVPYDDDPDAATGCADDALPGSSEDWRAALQQDRPNDAVVEALVAIAERILDRGYISSSIEEERADHAALVAALSALKQGEPR